MLFASRDCRANRAKAYALVVPIDAVLFDIGGVLEITPPTGWQERWEARLSLERGELERRLGPLFHAGATGRMTLEVIERGIAAELSLDHGATASFMDDLWREYLGTLNGPLVAYFASLRPRFRTGILSNSFVGAREREREAYGFEEICDEIVYSHEVGLLKPDPAIYHLASRRLGAQVQGCVLVDDTPECVEGARAVGMHAISFSDNDQAIRELEQLLTARR